MRIFTEVWGRLLLPAVLFTFAQLLSLPGCFGAASDQDAQNSVRVECVSPTGQLSDISNKHEHEKQIASIVDGETISCALPEGLTTFIIALPKNGLSDRFVFLNENATARGELKIAVANSALPPNSSKWTEVEGIVPFANKRLFNLSMLGVDTRFVRLSFRVEKAESDSDQASQANVSLNAFRASALAAAINSKFAKLHGNHTEINLATLSVEPLFAGTNK